MADVTIEGRSGDKATLLLAAAETLGLEAGVVRTTSGAYIVPEEVAKEAGLGDGDEAPRPAAKKTAAKKTAAKKTASKPKDEE